MIYLILTLNHCYPDYDFSLLRAHHFRKEPGVAAVEEAVDSHLLEVSKVSPSSPRLRALNPRPLDLCLLQSAAGLRPANMNPSSPAGVPGIVTQCCSAIELKEGCLFLTVDGITVPCQAMTISYRNHTHIAAAHRCGAVAHKELLMCDRCGRTHQDAGMRPSWTRYGLQLMRL